MREDLRKFMLRLAGDPELLARYITSPWETGEEEGLVQEDLDVLFSGDQQQIYLAIAEPQPQPQPAAQPQPQQRQQQQPAAGYWVWTPWGWQLWPAR